MRLAIAVMLVASTVAAGDKDAAKFSAQRDKVYAAALEVIGTEYRIEQVSKESGMISFRTGMSMKSSKGQDFSLLVIEVEGGSKVIVNSEKRGSQIITWGEGGSIKKKVLHLIGKKLAEDGTIPASEVPKP